jgi:dienelactone hydrolase
MLRKTLALVLLCLAPCTSSAQQYSRENLRIPFAAAGPRGLEAQLVRPADGRQYPLALMSHGTPRDADARAQMAPGRYYMQAVEFARRGFAVLIVMRRAYGGSGGQYAENSGVCGRRDYLRSASASAEDLRAAVEAMRGRGDVTTQGMIAIGQSAGGLASVALAANPPQGLAAVLNFAGGRGSRAENDVCDQDNLVAAFGTFGRTARVPMLWVYSENDLFFWPELARRFHAAFQASGGQAKFIAAPAFGRDGHSLFSARGAPIWTPMADAFLRERNLGLRTPLPAPTGDALPAPAHFRAGGSGRESFRQYLLAGDHKAFAVSPSGRYGWRTGMRSEREARAAALEACEREGVTCSIYAVDDELEGERSAPARDVRPAVPAR